MNLDEFSDYRSQLDLLLLQCCTVCCLALRLNIDYTESHRTDPDEGEEVETFNCLVSGSDSWEHIQICIGRTTEEDPIVTLANTRIDPITIPTLGIAALDIEDIRPIVVQWLLKVAVS